MPSRASRLLTRFRRFLNPARSGAVGGRGTVDPQRLEPRIALCGAGAVSADLYAHVHDALPATIQPLRHERRSVDSGGTRRRAAGERRPPSMVGENLTTPTSCAEEDNVNVPLSLPRRSKRFSFTIEARHPAYEIGYGNREPDFSSCPPATSAASAPQETIKLYDDHVSTAVLAVRDPNFHTPGMRVTVPGNAANDVHFIRLVRKVADADSWPEVLVLYSDGNLRLKPQAPVSGGDQEHGGDPAFGSSVIVGPTLRSTRPVAQVRSVSYDALRHTFRVTYAAGGFADLRIQQVDRFATRVRVMARFATSPDTPFATLRSMFVAEGNSDVDQVVWVDDSGVGHAEGIMGFGSSPASEFLFRRATRSRHNTSAPDIWVGQVRIRR